MRRGRFRHHAAHLDRRGFSLLELLIALAVLLTAGLSLIALSRQSIEADRQAQAAEGRLAGARLVMLRASLLPRRDLDIRLGERFVDGYIVRTARPERTLYRIAVADTATSESELLVTVLYRPVEAP